MDSAVQEFKFKILLESGNGETRLINYSAAGADMKEARISILTQRYLILENALLNIDRNGYKLLEIIHVK